MPTFRQGTGNWIQYRSLSAVREIDFHSDRTPSEDDIVLSFHERMSAAYQRALSAPRQAQQDGIQYLILCHGHSTSRRGRTTIRSQIRALMRGRDATPYIVRRSSIQHDSVFVAAIRPEITDQAPASTAAGQSTHVTV